MKKIKVYWEVSTSEGEEYISLEQMGINSEEEWENLAEEHKEELLQEVLNELPERVSILVEKWKDK